MPELEIVASFGVGIDAIDRPACAPRSIPITNTPDVLTEDVADKGLALMLACCAASSSNDRYVRDGNWQRRLDAADRHARGRRLGILGLGRIGKAFASRAEALGMSIAYHGRTRQEDVAYPYHADPVSLARESDVLVLCRPAVPTPAGSSTPRCWMRSGPDGWLVNVARGSVSTSRRWSRPS